MGRRRRSWWRLVWRRRWQRAGSTGEDITPTFNNISLLITVGSGGGKTVVPDVENNVLVDSQPGTAGDNNNGGDEYSGGGGWGQSLVDHCHGGHGGVNRGDGGPWVCWSRRGWGSMK